MSTVLWANVLINGKVESDESDKYALYKHARKLDKITGELEVISFLSTQDFTDMQLNISDQDLPDGIDSTDELMAANGAWVTGAEAVEMLERLISYIALKNIRFGLLSNDFDQILSELKESLEFAKRAKSENGMFNFSVVM